MTSRPATSVGTGGRCARESVRESPVDGGRREEREREGGEKGGGEMNGEKKWKNWSWRRRRGKVDGKRRKVLKIGREGSDSREGLKERGEKRVWETDVARRKRKELLRLVVEGKIRAMRGER